MKLVSIIVLFLVSISLFASYDIRLETPGQVKRILKVHPSAVKSLSAHFFATGKFYKVDVVHLTAKRLERATVYPHAHGGCQLDTTITASSSFTLELHDEINESCDAFVRKIFQGE